VGTYWSHAWGRYVEFTAGEVNVNAVKKDEITHIESQKL
jgi:hypothetical protein